MNLEAFNSYQNEAERTAGTHNNRKEALTNWALGVAGEAGELAEIVKKHAFHGHDLDEAALMKEVGDVLWYLAVLCSELGYPFSEPAHRNLVKLRRRYPDGFSQADSRNRKVGEE